MYRGKKIIISITGIIFAVMFVYSCFLDTDSDEWDQDYLITFLAKDSINTQRIVLGDYNYPSNFKYITPEDMKPFSPLFSPLKDKILIKEGDYMNGYYFYIYYVEIDTLIKINPISGQNVIIRDPVWSIDGSGIYFNDEQFGARYYDLLTESVSSLTLTTGEGCFITSVKDTNELLIWSPMLANKNREEDNYYYYNLMSNDGIFISKLTNPYFLYTKWGDGGIHHHETDVTWDRNKGQFIFSYSDSTINHSCISTCDFNGLQKVDYTQGEYVDLKPKFGPDDIIFFERYDITTNTNMSYMINIKDKQEIVLKDYFEINGVELIQFVDY